MPVTLGQAVKQGDVLLEITAAEISARVLQTKAQLNQTQRDLAREKTLLAQNASTSDLVKSLEDRVAMTEAMVREAEVMQGYATITAPFDGVIARKSAAIGDLAAPALPLLELEGAGGFEIQLGVPDSLATQLQTGAELLVDVPTANLSFTGQLAELSSAAEADAHTVPARIAVPAGMKLRSGQFARVHLPGAPTHALLVPASAVTRLGQMDRVFVAIEQHAVLRLVKSGALHGDRVEILSGLAGGETIVVNPTATLRERQPLEVQP
jgi:RND family efflux transporter MFP subunit